jgi:hypothetical protein
VGGVRFVVCLAVAAAIAAGAPAASAFTPPPPNLTCSYQGPPSNTVTFTVGLGEDTLVLKRAGDEIKLYSVGFYGYPPKGKKKIKEHTIYQAPICNVTPTVQNTDLIVVVNDPDEESDLDVSLEGGPLAPGATPELDGTSEIETQVVVGDFGNTVRFVGGPEADWFRFGTNQGVAGVNLNAQEEAGSPDIDATMRISEPPQRFENPDGELPAASASTGDGDDKVTTSAGPEFNSSFGGAFEANGGSGNDTLIGTESVFTFIKGASGNDSIQGGPGQNVIFGGGGADSITGGIGPDYVEPGRGIDTAFLDGGRDIIAAADGMRDLVNCGARRDFASRDPKDRIHGCERRTTQRFHLKPFE